MGIKQRLAHSLTLIAKARQMGMEKVAVMTSGGKDSVLLLDVIMRSGVPAAFVHRYLVPGLEIDEEVHQATEKLYGIKIIRLPSFKRLEMFSSDTCCINRVFEATPPVGNSYEKFDEMITHRTGTPWKATGIRITDGPQRALALTRNPNPNPKIKKIYPIADWRKGEVWEFIRQQKLPISRVYGLIGRSLDCLNIEHVYPLKYGSPRDYERIVNDFPLMDALCWVYEKRVAKYGIANVKDV